MGKKKRIIITAIVYLGIFILSAFISDLLINGGVDTVSSQTAHSELPIVSVTAGGRQINEMHGFVSEEDGAYLRNSLTPVEDSKTVNLDIENADQINSVSYELYNDSFDTLVESGSSGEITKSGSVFATSISFSGELETNCEYCLHLIVDSGGSAPVHYYTRVHYGKGMHVTEKLKFVTDFNEATFSKGRQEDISQYLDATDTTSTDLSHVTQNSSADMVTWGSLSPVRTSDISITLWEINTEQAVFLLSYQVESGEEDSQNVYDVQEYYRVSYSSSTASLLDFRRTVSQQLSTVDSAVSDSMLDLGIVSTDDLSYYAFGKDDQYVYITDGRTLCLYDKANNIYTDVYSLRSDNEGIGADEQTGVRVISTDPDTGDLYFAVYGYMPFGTFEGQNGVLIYHYNNEDVSLSQEAFIPYTRSYVQLHSSISQLAYMNSSNDIYMMLDDSIYDIDIDLGYFNPVYENISGRSMIASNAGELAMTGDDSNPDSKQIITLIDLNSGETHTIGSDNMYTVPMGFTNGNIIFGLVDPQYYDENQDFTTLPVSELHIIKTDGTELKSYSREGYLITDVTVEDDDLRLELTSQRDASDTVYDGIIVNNDEEKSSVSLEQNSDSVRGTVTGLLLDGAKDVTAVRQTARLMNPGYDITKDYSGTDDSGLCYYLYSGGRNATQYQRLRDAVDDGNENGGLIMASNGKIVWQYSGAAYRWSLEMPDEFVTGEGSGLGEAAVRNIASYEGWTDISYQDASLSVPDAMKQELPVEAADLTGMELEDVLHFIYRDRLVAAKTGDDSWSLITGYDSSYIYMTDLSTGETSTVSMSNAEEMFDKAGNVYYSYLD